MLKLALASHCRNKEICES